MGRPPPSDRPAGESGGGAVPAAETADDRRARLFRETPLDRATRYALGLAWGLRPARLSGLPGLTRLLIADLVSPQRGLPDPERALARPDGLAGIAHDLSVPTLLEAYRRGLFPFCHVGPMKWWSPAERCVLSFGDLHLAKPMRRRMRRGDYSVTFDTDFDTVIKACAMPRGGRWPLTWITPAVMRAYSALHDAGHAHSFEVRNAAGELIGGGYGVAVGGAFFSESTFSRESDAAKIGFSVLNRHLAKWGFGFNDTKRPAPYLIAMGFRCVPRRAFLDRLAVAAAAPGRPGRWQVEDGAASVARWQPAGRFDRDPG